MPDHPASAGVREPSTGLLLSPAMAERYGVRRMRPLVVLLVGLVAATFVGGVLVLGWHLATPEVQAKLLGFDVVSDTRTDVTFEVRRDGATPTVCVLRARAADHTDVGYAEITITAGADYVQPTYPLATYARATSAEVLACAAGEKPRVDAPAFLPGTANPEQVAVVDGS